MIGLDQIVGFERGDQIDLSASGLAFDDLEIAQLPSGHVAVGYQGVAFAEVEFGRGIGALTESSFLLEKADR